MVGCRLGCEVAVPLICSSCDLCARVVRVETRLSAFVGEQLGVGEAAVVIDADVEVLVAGACFVASSTAAEETVAWPIETRQLLDIEVHKLAWPLVLVAVDGSSGSSRERFPRPTRFRINDTVESAIPSISAISAAVIRRRRRCTIASTRSGGVRRRCRRGREERSTSPSAPSSRQRARHFAAVRTLTPAAAAAADTRQPASSRSTNNCRLRGQDLALP